jgi:hypothetical protein
VPTLSSALAALARSPSAAFLEVKDPDVYGGVAGIGTTVHEMLEQEWPASVAGAPRGLVTVQSFDDVFIKQFAAAYPTMPVSVIGPASPETVSAFAGDMQVYYGTLTPQTTAAAHDNGLTIGAYTVDDPASMRRLATEIDVDSITSNMPARLRDTMTAEGLRYTGTAWPGKVTGVPRWSLTTSGRYLASRVPLTATLTAADGSPAAWQFADVQRWENGAWRHLMWRATDAHGRFSTTVAGTPSLRVRVVSRDDWQYPITAAAKDVPLSKVGTSVQLTGPYAVRRGRVARLAVGWTTSSRQAVTGSARLYKRRVGGSWHFVRQLRVTAGAATTRVYPTRTMRYRLRGSADWWHNADFDDAIVRVPR